ncbi:MAG: multicopper oxidase family protein [Sandaracinaceae bacterium]|nr:multicopper oxidase family protein [Sandaracinaceae bacterium]
MRRFGLVVVVVLGACSSPASLPPGVPQVIDVAPTEGPFDGMLAADLDPAPNVVEVALEARPADVEIAPGRTMSLWTYNGMLPGPRIEASVGDLVRVRFTNSLSEPTTIHWHGVRVPAAMDGVTAAQDPVPVGGTFTYEFTVPDAGTFWYHPHVRSDEQVERGLYGTFVVRGSSEPDTTSEHVVALDDLLVDDAWQLEAFAEEQAMIGRQGNLLITNGHAHPIADVRAGGLHRFRFVNAANARYFLLAMPDGQSFWRIGTDGGLLEEPQSVSEVLLVPGERADVLVRASSAPAESVEWVSRSYDRGHGTGQAPEAIVFQMRTTMEAAIEGPAVPASFGSIEALSTPAVTRELRLGESAGGHGGHGGGTSSVVFSINGQSFPAVDPLAARLGDVEEWSIVNETEMDHPFHLHGFRFQLAGERAWRDTINVPQSETVRFLVRLETNPGVWMFHCHILEHAERGMMGELDVQPAP